jgi:hypothetical protein
MVPGGSRESLPKRKVRFADIRDLRGKKLVCRSKSAVGQ